MEKPAVHAAVAGHTPQGTHRLSAPLSPDCTSLKRADVVWLQLTSSLTRTFPAHPLSRDLDKVPAVTWSASRVLNRPNARVMATPAPASRACVLDYLQCSTLVHAFLLLCQLTPDSCCEKLLQEAYQFTTTTSTAWA